jgi:hypothetical protein
MHYLAEFYLPAGGAPLAELSRQASSGAQLVEASGTFVHFIRFIHVPQDESCFALYTADTAEAVAAAGRLAGIAFDRVVAAATAP